MHWRTFPDHKKGIHGIGILLIFIATLLIAVAASGLLIHNSNKLAEDGLSTYSSIKDNLKYFQVVEVSGHDGRDQQLNLLTIDAKLVGDSTPMDLSRMSLFLGEKDQRIILNYRETDSPDVRGNTGFNTWVVQEFGALTYTQNPISTIILPIQDDARHTVSRDLDGDSINDEVEICDDDAITVACPAAYEGTHLVFILSSGAQAYAELRNQDGTLVNVSTGGQVLDVVKSPIIDAEGEHYGYISLSGTTTAIGYEIGSNGETITVYSNGYLIDADLDDDGEDDYLGLDATHFYIDLSNHTEDLVYPLGADLSSGAVTLDVNQRITNGERYGTMLISGTTSAANTIDADVTVQLTPYHDGSGYYTAKHLISASTSRPGYMVPGDVLRFYVEPYSDIHTDDIIDIRIMYHDLEAIAKQIYVGNTFPLTDKVILWPKP